MKEKKKHKHQTQSAIIDAAIKFDMSNVVKRYIKEQGISADLAAQHENELKRYLVLCTLHPKAAYAMRGQVDELWHVFIFFTKEYFSFCKTVAGKYIHHIPHDPDTTSTKSTYPDMLKAYELVYGEKPPADIWPAVSSKAQGTDAGTDVCSTSCDTCGGGGSSCGSGCSSCDTCGV